MCKWYEVPYIYALETAMDELAVKLHMDPVELRRINDTMKDPIKGVPYTSRSLVPCFEEASKAFGWARRSAEPGSMRDGDWLIGWGCAMACYPSQMSAAAARVRLERGGKVRVQIAAQDVGTGAYTVIGQMAAARLGVSLTNVRVELGDSALPPGPIAGGSITTASACSAVSKACDSIREKLFRAASIANDGPLSGQQTSALTLSDRKVIAGDASEGIDRVLDRLGVGALEEYAEWTPRELTADAIRTLYNGGVPMVRGATKDRIAFAFGAEFVEVRMHAQTRNIRVPRVVGAFAAGRIMNPRTARSQLMGGMIWGISSALHEETEIDVQRAKYVNDNLADYLIPVNADIEQVDVILLSEEDNELNPAGVKGLGELGNVGTAAAISNAVYHATGTRIRELPIRIEKILNV
jgi:xanthine dehydrogenase YagR molybdenum-binding subunit